MADVTIKANDTYPPLAFTLSDDSGPVDLSAADEVLILMKPQSGSGAASGTCAVDEDQSGNKGKGTFDWGSEAGITATPGTYNVEFQVTWEENVVQTFPNTGYLSVEIVADLGPES